MSKLALGTVQFGLDYGINNTSGQINTVAAKEILSEAQANQVEILDTAAGYGNSELVIGEFLKQAGNSFKVISKLPDCQSEEVKKHFNNSLQRLGLDSIYGYIFHNFATYKNQPDTWQVLEELKSAGKVKKIGFSLYYPQELEMIISQKLKVDLLQIPFSVLDQRFSQHLAKIKQLGIEVHVRSVFLQGLLFKDPKHLAAQFAGIKDKLMALNKLASDNGLSLVELCLNFATLNEIIDKVVVGVDNLNHFKQIITAEAHNKKVASILPKLLQLKEESEQILIPQNWEKVA